MTLETKLRLLESWTAKEAAACWERYHTLYSRKHYGALFQALTRGESDKYIQREAETFRRYVRFVAYFGEKQ